MRSDDNKFILLFFVQYFLFQYFGRQWIESRRWLVQYQNRGIEHKSETGTYFLTGTAGKCTHTFIQHLAEIKFFVKVYVQLVFGYTPDIFHHIQYLADSHILWIFP